MLSHPVPLLSHCHHQPCWLQVEWRWKESAAIADLAVTEVYLRGLPVLLMHPTRHSSSSSPTDTIVSSPASKLRSAPFCPSAPPCDRAPLCWGYWKVLLARDLRKSLAQRSAPSRDLTVRTFTQDLVLSNSVYLQKQSFHKLSANQVVLPVKSTSPVRFSSLTMKHSCRGSTRTASATSNNSVCSCIITAIRYYCP